MERVKCLASRFEQGPNQINDGVCSIYGADDRLRIADIGLHKLDLANISDNFQFMRGMRVPHSCAYTPAPRRQGTDDIAAQKT